MSCSTSVGRILVGVVSGSGGARDSLLSSINESINQSISTGRCGWMEYACGRMSSFFFFMMLASQPASQSVSEINSNQFNPIQSDSIVSDVSLSHTQSQGVRVWCQKKNA